jgi:hypothetical protein
MAKVKVKSRRPIGTKYLIEAINGEIGRAQWQIEKYALNDWMRRDWEFHLRCAEAIKDILVKHRQALEIRSETLGDGGVAQ